jgi:hypothetical protein
MFNLFKNDTKDVAVTNQHLIAEIHNEFDTAENRLLREAKQILEETRLPENEKTGERLLALGFENTSYGIKAKSTLQKTKELKLLIAKTRSQVDMINYYKFKYPFLKFITEEELNKICIKYNLIYSSVKNYIGDVPIDKIKEIELAKELEKEDMPKPVYKIKLSKFNKKNKEQELMCMLYEKHFPDGYISRNDGYCADQLVQRLNEIGYDIKAGFNHLYDLSEEKHVFEINKSGLFICAPKNQFNLKKWARINCK